jgi:LPXTG-site transpeptidase (sortase) family protein
MNQILVTKKLYITPELKRKKKVYKFEFFLSIFLVCILISAYIYAEYDRNKSEQVSQEILANLEIQENDTTVAKSNVLVVVLNDENDEEDISQQETTQQEATQQATTQKVTETNNSAVQTTANGYQYMTIGTINIPKINVKYPILDGLTDSTEETEDLLKISPTKFWGPELNEVGNFCIVGHNYRNTRFFSKVPTLESGDIIEITDLSGQTIQYKVYNKYQVEPTDVSCTTQLTNGKKEITLITCTDDSKYRVVVKAREVK